MFLLAGILAIAAPKKGTLVIQGQALHEVLGISPNGKWACGIYDNNGENKAYAWDIENNRFTYFGEGMSQAWGIANDGTICGIFVTSEVAKNGAPVTSGGYWKDGKLNLLKDEQGNPILSDATVITPDGQYIGGTILVNNEYLPCIWKNGILEKRLDSNRGSARVSAISEDGQMASGWYTDGNRRACYWKPELVPMGETKGFTCDINSISPNKRYLLGSDGTAKLIYDLQTQQMSRIPNLMEDYWSDGTIQIMDDGTAIVWENQAPGILGADGLIYKDGTFKKITDWLSENWNTETPEGLGNPGLVRFSKDMKTLVGLCIGGYNDYGQPLYYPVTWMADREVNLVKPNAFTSEQLLGTNYMMLKWAEPSANSESVTGYRIYRGGTKLAEVNADKLVFTDKTAAAVNLSYQVSALYGTEESEKLESNAKMSDSRYAPQPTTFTTYQSNYNNVVLNWTAPNQGYDAQVRLHNEKYTIPFGAGIEKTFWAGVNFNSDLIGAYADNFILSGIEFYPCEEVQEMSVVIYAEGTVVHSQPIDQSNLTWGCNNVVKLNKTITLPANGEIKVAIKITQSAQASPIGMAQGPAVEGGDLCSEDGSTWTTIKEMSEGSYNYNWMISLLLESNGNDDGALAPPSRSASSLAATSYALYRDGEKIHELDLNETPGAALTYVDQNVKSGRHSYELEATFNNSMIYSRRASNITVDEKKISYCAAPVNIKGVTSLDKNLTLTWDMPEKAEMKYTNWITQLGITITGAKGWYCGVKYDAEQMRPFAGFNITKVNFWPLESVTYTLHVYEGGEPIYSQEIPQYSLNKLNSITLDQPVIVKPYKAYLIAIQVSNVPSDKRPIAVDTDFPYPNGRLISSNGVDFADAQIDMNGNFMISMEMEKITKGFNPGLTYKVYVDGNAENNIATENTYERSVTNVTGKTVKVSVAAIFPTGEKKSDEVVVSIDPNSIGQDEISIVRVYPNPTNSFIHIEGDVSTVSLYNAAGQEVYRESGSNTINISSFSPGIYLLKSLINGKMYTNKIQVTE